MPRWVTDAPGDGGAEPVVGLGGGLHTPPLALSSPGTASPPSSFTSSPPSAAALTAALADDASSAGSTPKRSAAPAAEPATPPPMRLPAMGSFALDAEGNFKLAIQHALAALKRVPAAAVRAARERLRAAYVELGAMYVAGSRFTKACRHYQQGVELFRSTQDLPSAAHVSVAFGLALRSRLRLEDGVSSDREAVGWQIEELARAGAAFAQAHELPGSADADAALWRQAEAERGRTLLLVAERHAARDDADGVAHAVALYEEAATRLERAGEPDAAGDAECRLGALHSRAHLRGAELGEEATVEDAAAAVEAAKAGVRARQHFQRALELLPADARPVDHILVLLDLVRLHRRGRAGARVDALAEALRALLATHAAFLHFSFPLPPPGARGGSPGGGERDGGDDAQGSTTCALVARLWPLVESELQEVLKEMIKEHGGDAAKAALFKGLYRLALVQRDTLGTDMLQQLAVEWGEQVA